METLSPKVLFYLEHRRRIREWANLEGKAAEEIHDWVLSWADHMETEASPRDRNLAGPVDGADWPKLLWYRENWLAESSRQSAEPITITSEALRAGIGFEWVKGSVYEQRGFYYGVWVNRDLADPVNVKFRRRLREATAKERGAGQRKWWPIFRFPPDSIGDVLARALANVESDYESDAAERALDSFRIGQIEQAEDVWAEFAPMVDRVIRG